MIALTEKYKPATLDGFAGLTVARRIVAAIVADPYECALLFVGDTGTGKTTLGMAFADALRAQLHHVPSRQCDLETVDRTCAACHYPPMKDWKPTGGDFHVVLVDEADKMTHAAQLAFLSKLDGTAHPPKTIFVFTANETKLLEPRFLGRCRRIKFDGRLEIAASVAFLARVWAAETSAPAPDFAALLDQSGNLRAALNELEMELIAPGSLVIDSPALPVKRAVTLPSPAPAVISPGETIDAQTLACVLGINSSTIYTWVKRGKLPQPVRKAPWTWNRSQIAQLQAVAA